MSKQKFGMIGLGVMGQNFSLNVERNGFSVAVYDINQDSVQAYLKGKAAGKNVKAGATLKEFVALLEKPRRIMLLVPAGKPVDAVIRELIPLLSPGDLVIDGGNSYFQETERRAKWLQNKRLNFFGMGVSGGEEGALWGPSLMPGGSKEAYQEVEAIMQAVFRKGPGRW